MLAFSLHRIAALVTALCGLCFVFGTAGCISPATEVVFLIDTDIPVSVPGVLRVTVQWAGEGAVTTREYRWTRAPFTMLTGQDAGLDAGFGTTMFPASFAVVPNTTRPDRAFVAGVELILDNGITVRRRLSRTLLTHFRQTVDVFLAARCLDPSAGCQSEPCTRQLMCEEQGKTCNDNGDCVTPETLTRTEIDGSVDASRRPAECGRFGQACCLFAEQCRGGLSCSPTNVCVRCPPGSEACCDGETLRADGTACGMAAQTCLAGGRCQQGVCTPGGVLPNGSSCMPAANPCQTDGVCTDGVCTAPQSRPDGSVCSPTVDPCLVPGVCMNGMCNPPQLRPDGTVCERAADSCHVDGVCSLGTCTGQRPVANGTVCGRAMDSCHRDPVCTVGVCGAPVALAEGAICAPAGSSCQRAGTCRAGACTGVSNVMDGTVCAAAADPCQVNGTCRAGMCSGTTPQPDGTVCAMAPAGNVCQTNGTCTAGRCSGLRNVPNGAVRCAVAGSNCQTDGLCTNGACPGPGNVANGTVCRAAGVPACQNAGTCTNGVCGAVSNRPNGTVCGAGNNCQNPDTCQGGACANGGAVGNNVRPTATTQCCGGVEVSRASASHCNVCNLACATGTCAADAINGFGTQYYCRCTGANAQCTPRICRTGQASLNNRCACQNSAQCPGGSVCQNVNLAPNFCRP